MKHFYLLVLFVATSLCYSQSQKDALLAQDSKKIESQLRLMEYLNKAARQYFTMTDAQRADANATFNKFYTDSIAANNPSTDVTVSEYLEYKEHETPLEWREFATRVFFKNMETLLVLTQKYGYLSPARLKPHIPNLNFSTVTHLAQESAYDKPFRALVKSEYKVGNIPEKEYQLLLFMLKRKKEITPKDAEQLEKNAGVKIISN